MKKLALVVSIFLIGIGIKAQGTLPVSFSIRVGANVSNSTWDVKSDNVDKKGKIGFQVGVMAEYTFPTPFQLQTGLFLTTKGAKLKMTDTEESGETTNIDQTLNQMYLEIPISAAYKMYISNNTCLFFNLGPYIAYGIGGKNKIKTRINNEAETETKEDTFGDKGLKKFDLGLVGGVGMEFGRIIVSLNCELGLKNLSNSDDYKYKNVTSLATLGYRF